MKTLTDRSYAHKHYPFICTELYSHDRQPCYLQKGESSLQSEEQQIQPTTRPDQQARQESQNHHHAPMQGWLAGQLSRSKSSETRPGSNACWNWVKVKGLLKPGQGQRSTETRPGSRAHWNQTRVKGQRKPCHSEGLTESRPRSRANGNHAKVKGSLKQDQG